MQYQAKTCTLSSGAVVTFDAPDTTDEDTNQTVTWYEIFTRLVGA